MLTYWRIYFEKKKKYANISLSIESVRGTAPLTTQQPERDFKVLKAESMGEIKLSPSIAMGFICTTLFMDLEGVEMKKFDFNIKRKGVVFVKVDDRVDDFLQQAKENGYRFGNGKTITLKSDEKSFHYAVTEDNKLFRLSTQCWLFVDKVDRLVY